jgi:excisionase family DNA binding protein
MGNAQDNRRVAPEQVHRGASARRNSGVRRNDALAPEPSRGSRAGRREIPRIALTRQEAAQSLGVGLTTFKQQVQPHLRIVRRGKVRLIPVTELERWLEENAEPVAAEQA